MQDRDVYVIDGRGLEAPEGAALTLPKLASGTDVLSALDQQVAKGRTENGLQAPSADLLPLLADSSWEAALAADLLATGATAREHTVGSPDGDIFLLEEADR